MKGRRAGSKASSKKAKKDKELEKYLAGISKTNQLANQALQAKIKAQKGSFKLLLLGAGESGKTTVRKQIQLLHGDGFDQDERVSYREKIWYNLIDGTSAIVRAQQTVGIKISDAGAKEAAEKILAEDTRLSEPLAANRAQMTPELAGAIQLLWQNEDVQSIYTANAEYQLQECFNEFADALENYPEWGGPEWVPSNEDILRCRARTTGVVDSLYKIGDKTFQVIDVGGQRAERRKWMGLFKGVTGMIFVVAMSGYDQRIFENNTTNRLEESLDLWGQMANRDEFETSAVILFLNKYDVFQRKYRELGVPIKYDGKYLGLVGPPPEAKDDDKVCTKACKWFEKLYVSLVRNSRRKQLFTHITTALDPENMDQVIGACAVHILTTNMEKSGLVTA